MSREARPSHQVDLEHPWLGLESFSEKTRDYFFGRDAEVAELLQRLRLHPLLVFYGRSGLGKTSLLRARVVPELEKFGARPALYRISYRKGEESPLDQLLVALEVLGRLDVPGLALPNDPASRLWLHFHYRDGKNRVTHLILDQFEEIFTLGADWPGADLQVREALAILAQGAIRRCRDLARRRRSLGQTFSDRCAAVAGRTERAAGLFFRAESLAQPSAPDLPEHFELRALRGPDALNAVFKPGELRCHYRDEVREENKADTGLQPIAAKKQRSASSASSQKKARMSLSKKSKPSRPFSRSSAAS